MAKGYDIRRIRPEQTHVIRHTVLRPHQRLDEMVYDGDDLPTTLHLGAFEKGDETQEVIGIVTLSAAPMPGGGEESDTRLRGMAVARAAQGTGAGRQLVEQAIREVASQGGRRIWCNARVSAMGFYEKLGFTAHGEQFDIPRIGPHYVMSVSVDTSASSR